MRIIVDTNLWISILIKHRLRKLTAGLSDGQITLVVCNELVDEIIRVFRRPKFSGCYSEAQLITLRAFLEENTEKHIINGAVMGCRDPKDDFLLELAADVRLSGTKYNRVKKQIIQRPGGVQAPLQGNYRKQV